MTDATNSPWAGRVPEVQAEHTMSVEDFASINDELTQVLNGRVCCPDHGARLAVTVAVAALIAKHGDKLDTIDRELHNVCNLVMNNFRNGSFRPDAGRMSG